MTDSDIEVPTLGRLTRRTFATVLGLIENRAELLALEFEEESVRVLKLLIFGVGALILSMMTLLLITGVVIFIVPEPGRLWVAVGFACLYLAGTIGAAFAVKGLVKQAPFAESLKQIKKDSELLDAFK
jgi:uncharacterized membrane protein YqjE